MNKEIKPWGDYILESHKKIHEHEQHAKKHTIKAVNEHFENLYPEMESDKKETFKLFLNKMNKL